ncbi:MAG TPA: efflux RND transporter periplasmic adaptor subunit [Pseudolabrys sp.]|nr:efflux RND transporter periplasmic adaptor subunit [Pseudolabrys sp.]
MHGELPKQIWAKTSTRNRRVAVGVIVIVIGVALYYVFSGSPPPQNRSRFGAESGPVPILVTAATKADVPVYLDAVGTIKALNTVTVRPQVDGKLLSVGFKEGDDVKKGDVLAQIDPVTYQAQLDQAIAKKAQDEAQLANAKLDLDRYEKLAATNAINRQQADTQRALVAQDAALVQSDQAAIESAQATVGYTTIVAPINGRTGIRMVDEGNIVHASDATSAIVVITELKPITVLFNLPQQDIGQVNSAFATGPLTVEAQQPDGDAILDRGTLRVVDNQVDQTTGTVKLKAEFPNAGLALWPGQFVNIRLLIDTLKGVVTIPTGAVQRGPNGTFVYVVKDDSTASMRPIVVQKQDETQTVVKSGVSAGDRVVTTGFVRLTDGSKVAIGNNDGTPVAIPARQRGQRSGSGRPNTPQ